MSTNPIAGARPSWACSKSCWVAHSVICCFSFWTKGLCVKPVTVACYEGLLVSSGCWLPAQMMQPVPQTLQHSAQRTQGCVGLGLVGLQLPAVMKHLHIPQEQLKVSTLVPQPIA